MTRPGTELRDAALAYAARGIPVLPLHHPSPAHVLRPP
jgi:uracil-DNA glycosylase